MVGVGCAGASMKFSNQWGMISQRESGRENESENEKEGEKCRVGRDGEREMSEDTTEFLNKI